MDAALLKWLGEAYGPIAPLVAVLLWFAWKNKTTKPDVINELMLDVKETKNTVIDLRERVARIEGKLDHD